MVIVLLNVEIQKAPFKADTTWKGHCVDEIKIHNVMLTASSSVPGPEEVLDKYLLNEWVLETANWVNHTEKTTWCFNSPPYVQI